MKIFEKIKVKKEKEIRFLGLPIFQYGKREAYGISERYFTIFPKSFLNKLLDEIIKTTNKVYKNIIILRCGSGESTLLNFALEAFLKKNKIDNFCLVTSFERTMSIDILKSHHPELDIFTLDIPQYILNDVLNKNYIKYKKHNFYVHLCTLSEMQKQLLDVSNHTAECKNHPAFYLKKIGVEEFEYSEPQPNNQIEEQLRAKLPNLDFNNFVFLAPEATSVSSLKDFFWEKICSELKKQGYDIFANTKSGYYKFAKSTKLSIAEALYLAKMSKMIIGLRSGFIELLAQFKIPKHIIYTPYKWQNFDEDTTLEYYTLKNYPFVKARLLNEYKFADYTSKTLAEEILKNIKKGKKRGLIHG